MLTLVWIVVITVFFSMGKGGREGPKYGCPHLHATEGGGTSDLCDFLTHVDMERGMVAFWVDFIYVRLITVFT